MKCQFERYRADSTIKSIYYRYSVVGLFANEDRNVPWNDVYSNLRMRGKRTPAPEPILPWEAVYSLRGKKTVANLPWQMSLQSPMLRGKKSASNLPWQMSLQSPMLRGKKLAPILPWQMSLQSPMLRGKKSTIMPWTMNLQSPMLRGKKTKTLVNLPWQMDLKSPMLRGKKSTSTQIPLELTIPSPLLGEDNISEDSLEKILNKGTNNNIRTRANLPWVLDYLSPMMRG